MSTIVLKFGGTSVASPEARELVYARIIAAKEAGFRVVAVISAMGRRGAPYATDTLLDLLPPIDTYGVSRERTLLQISGEIIAGSLITANLQQKGLAARYLTGQQAGIITTSDFDDAQIVRIKTERILSYLACGETIIVAGGQGGTEDGEVTSLGRGGSDITACALGVALEAARVEIYSDVGGIMTADPHLVSGAKTHTCLNHAQCYLLASQGAKVMHPRAVEAAAQDSQMPLYIKSIFSDEEGTKVIGTGVAGDNKEPLFLGITIRNAEQLKATKFNQGQSPTYSEDRHCVSIIGNALLQDPMLEKRLLQSLKLEGLTTFAHERHQQVLFLWTRVDESASVAQILHDYLLAYSFTPQVENPVSLSSIRIMLPQSAL